MSFWFVCRHLASYPSAGCDSGVPGILSHTRHHLLNRHLNKKNHLRKQHLRCKTNFWDDIKHNGWITLIKLNKHVCFSSCSCFCQKSLGAHQENIWLSNCSIVEYVQYLLKLQHYDTCLNSMYIKIVVWNSCRKIEKWRVLQRSCKLTYTNSSGTTKGFLLL